MSWRGCAPRSATLRMLEWNSSSSISDRYPSPHRPVRSSVTQAPTAPSTGPDTRVTWPS
jgi:hypothetical protein